MENKFIEINNHSCRVERAIAALELFKLFVRSETALPECVIELHDSIEEALVELYGVKREIKEEIREIESEEGRGNSRIVYIGSKRCSPEAEADHS